MQTTTRSSYVPLTFLLLFILLFVFFFYTFLHEGGHALAGQLFGQTLTEFDVSFWDFSAQVGMAGGELTPSQLAVQAVAGVSLPLLVWAIFIHIAPRKASFALEALKLISSMAVLNTLLAWIVIPVLYVFGKSPPSDDVTHFLRYSQMVPLLLTLIALVVYTGGWVYFLSRTEEWRNGFLLFRRIDSQALTKGSRAIIPVMTGILIFSVSCALLLDYVAVHNSSHTFFPPQDFAVVAEIDLSRQAYSTEPLAEFTLEEPAYVGVFIAVRNVNTTYFDLSVVGPDGYRSVVMHGEGYRSDRDNGLWEELLRPGTYQLVLTSNPSPGTAAIFVKTD